MVIAMTKPAVYLAGPVQHVEDNGRGWRESIQTEYEDRFEVLNPLDKYDVDADELTIVADYPSGPGEVSTQEIVDGDKGLIDRADALLVRWVTVPSVGTPMEIHYAHQQDIPVCIWKADDRTLSPWMSHHASAVRKDPDWILDWIETQHGGDAGE